MAVYRKTIVLLSVIIFFAATVSLSHAQSTPVSGNISDPTTTLPRMDASSTLSLDAINPADIDSVRASLPETEGIPGEPEEPLQPDLESMTSESASSSAETFFNAEEFPDTTLAERLKAKTVSMDLKQFGYDFFSVSGGFKPDPLALVGPDYIIGPGDTLRVDVWGTIEGNYSFTVDRNGEIVIPKVGVINLWGQTFTQAKETIRKQIGKYFTKFELNVTMGSLRSIQVFMVGEIHSPGTYQVTSVSTVLTALSTAGGPSKNGTLRNVQLLRNGKLISTIDLYDFFLKGDKSNDVRLQSGDTIFVPLTGPLVGVAGSVRRPAIYELKDQATLEDALGLAGGLVPTAYLQKVQVDRIQAHKTKTVLDIDIGVSEDTESNLSMTLQDRDRIRVGPISSEGGYVFLDGHATRTGEYALTAGMRLSDLILSYDNLLPEFYPDLAEIIRLNPPEYQPELITINLQKALENDPDQNILLQEFDTVRLFSREDMEELPEVTVSGAVLNPGTFRLFENMTVRDLVTAAGNLKRNASLFEAEITRYIPAESKTHSDRILFNLEKAIEGDPDHNITLQVDDHLFVRSIPDSSERETVQIVGEVLYPGTYAISKGEKLASLIERAGGYTEDAYLRGAFFTRESLKETQRIQTNRLISEQENEIMRISSEMAAGAMDDEDIAASEAILESRKQLIVKLKQTQTTGRMVINLKEPHQLSDSSDNIELMAGDTLTIPSNPQTVSVLGEVYTPISMTYEAGGTVEYYLEQVGGLKDTANKDELYVVRADGSVVSKKQKRRGRFYSLQLYPGDVVMVPEEVKTSDWMKFTKDITTILYQIGIGAAVVLAL